YLIYSNNPLVDIQAGGRLDIGNFSQRLITPTLGTSTGNQVAVSLDVISVLKRNKPNSWMGAVYAWHYTDDDYIEQSDFDYQLLPDKRSIDGPLSTSSTKDYWQGSSEGVVELRETVNYNNVVLGQAGINQRSTLYLAEGYAINTQECFVIWTPFTPPFPVCYLRDKADTLHIDVGDKLIFDIFPASLDEFYAMSDPEADGSYSLAWDSRFPPLRDADGDGLRSRALGGDDPDDSSADSDADGLSDYYEVYNNTNPTDADEDRDGLSDYQELIYNTNPHQADSDNDGLQDGEEVFHQTGLGLWVGGWEYTYGYDASDQPLKTLVIADPLNPDTDGDGYLDKQEQVYGFNPNVASVGSVLNVSSQLNDADGVVAPGATVVYSATIENDLRNRYALGLLDVDFPVAVQDESLDPQTFVLAEREQATVAGQVTVRPDLISSQRISLTNIAGAAIVNLRGDTNEQRNLWLHLNENVGATHFVDTSLLGHHGTCSGNTCPTAGQPGYAGHAVQFDGQDDYVQIPYAAALNPSNFSVAAWVKVMGSSFSHQSVLTLRDDYPQRGYILYVTPFNTWQFVLGDGSGWVDIDGGPVTIGEWTHLAAGYNASSETMRFYINGQLMVSRTNVSFAPNTQRPLRIGAGATEGAPQYHFNGLVDELEIYPRTLSDVEVAERFKESVFHVDFDGNVEDESAYRNSITCSGSRCPVVSDKKAVFDKQVHYDVASSANLDLSQGSGHFSLAAWIYPEGDTRDYTGAMDTWQAIFGNDQDKKNAYPTIWVNKEGKLKAGFGDGSQGLCSFESIAPILNLHQWNHILVTFGPAVLAQADLAESDIEPQSIDEQATSSGQLFKLYVNGQRIPGADLVGASACAGKSPPATNNFWIGRASQRASVHFNGVWTLDDHGDASGAAEHKLFLDGEALLPGGLHGVQEWTWYTFDKSRTISDDGQHTVVYCEDDTGNYSGCFGGDDRLLLLYFNNTVIGRHKSRWWGYGGELDWSVANDFYQGQIDDLSIYRYALTEDEAWDLYMGTVAYGRRLELRFDEPPGSAIFRDYSGNNLTGDCTGTTCPDTGIPGRSNQTARFDGEDDYVQIPYARELNPASFTVSAWVKVMGDSDSHRSVLTSRDDLPQKGYILYATPNDTWEFWVGDGTQWQIVGGTPVTLDVWTHLVARYEAASQTMNLYVNGQLAGSQAGVSLARNTRRPLRIGAGMTETSPPQFYFDGLIDQVIVYSRALSDAEIDDLTLARRLWLPLEESAGATQFSDASGSGYTGYCGGVTCPTMNVAGQTVGTAAQFDGINDYLWLDSYPPLAHASFTLAAWANRVSSGPHDLIIGQWSQSRRR
ncbi:MAG: LamG domain-containing protein, partial [Chloroflexi bacterium]|nr:LamG domain-containing protein [Chloroflexota bacterium]